MPSLVLKADAGPVRSPIAPGLATKPAPQLSRATKAAALTVSAPKSNKDTVQHGVHVNHLPRLEEGASDEMRGRHEQMSKPSRSSYEHCQKLGGHNYMDVSKTLGIAPQHMVSAALQANNFDEFKNTLLGGNKRLKGKGVLNPKDEDQSQKLLAAYRSMGLGDHDHVTKSSAPIVDGLAWFDSRGNGIWKSLEFGVKHSPSGPALHAVSAHGLGTGTINIHSATKDHTATWTGADGKTTHVGQFSGPDAQTQAITAIKAHHTMLQAAQPKAPAASAQIDKKIGEEAGTGVFNVAKKKRQQSVKPEQETKAGVVPTNTLFDAATSGADADNETKFNPTPLPKASGDPEEYHTLPGGHYKIHRRSGVMHMASMAPTFVSRRLADRSMLRLMKSLASGARMVLDYTTTGKPIYADGRDLQDLNNDELQEVSLTHKDLSDRMLDTIYGVGGTDPMNSTRSDYLRTRLVDPHSKIALRAVKLLSKRYSKEFFGKSLPPHPKDANEHLGRIGKMNVTSAGFDKNKDSHKRLDVEGLSQMSKMFESKAAKHKALGSAATTPEEKAFHAEAERHYLGHKSTVDSRVTKKLGKTEAPKTGAPSAADVPASEKTKLVVGAVAKPKPVPPMKRKAGEATTGTSTVVKLRRMEEPIHDVDDAMHLMVPVSSMFHSEKEVADDLATANIHGGVEAVPEPSQLDSGEVAPTGLGVAKHGSDSPEAKANRLKGQYAKIDSAYEMELKNDPAKMAASKLDDDKLDQSNPIHRREKRRRSSLTARAANMSDADLDAALASTLRPSRFHVAEKERRKKLSHSKAAIEGIMARDTNEAFGESAEAQPSPLPEAEEQLADKLFTGNREDVAHHAIAGSDSPEGAREKAQVYRRMGKSMNDNEVALMIATNGGFTQGGEVRRPMNVRPSQPDVIDTGLPDPTGFVRIDAAKPAPLPAVKLMVGGVPSSAFERGSTKRM